MNRSQSTYPVAMTRLHTYGNLVSVPSTGYIGRWNKRAMHVAGNATGMNASIEAGAAVAASRVLTPGVLVGSIFIVAGE